MKRSELTEFAVEEEGFKLKIRRGSSGLPIASSSNNSNAPFMVIDNAAINAAPTTTALAPSASPSEDPSITFIKSPMVGTFYRAASPESKPFAEVGSVVTETSVACIIEAMKIMNEIQAEVKGTVIEALVENGQPVEYGQRLFKLKQG